VQTHPDVGYTLAPAHQGHGYASEAVGRVLAYLFEVRGLHRVSAECDARNVRSARLLARLGFRQEGHRVQNTWAKGEWTDDLLFGLLAVDWRTEPLGQSAHARRFAGTASPTRDAASSPGGENYDSEG
jgi:RimJ/RimL family protein N-acetyltransferase